MEFFLNPWFMAAGGVLVSSPIIIHLINRMRFKRLRWAAMEFLLKSQKRNRRRLIIEQLILLTLRILLVLLIALLVARWIYGGNKSTTGTLHVLVLDDTLSMRDRWKDQQGEHSAWAVGREQVMQLADKIANDNAVHDIKIFLLSELARFRITDKTIEALRGKGVPDDVLNKLAELKAREFPSLNDLSGALGKVLKTDEMESYQDRILTQVSDFTEPFFEERVNNKTKENIGKKLEDMQPTYLHASPLPGLEAARHILRAAPQGKKILYFVSDFRDNDWDAGSDAARIKQEIDGIVADGIHLNLLDTVDPPRSQNRGVAQHHDNIALVDLRASSRVVASDIDVVFTATIVNYGKSEKTNVGLRVYVDDKEDYRGKKEFARILPGKRLEEKFTLLFHLRDGAETQLTRVRAELRSEDSALEADDVRDVVVDVRHRVPILVVDGNNEAFKVEHAEGTPWTAKNWKTENPEDADSQFDVGDWKTLISGLAAGKAYEPQRVPVEALEKIVLDDYPTIYLLDLPPTATAEALDNLQRYVAKGGNVVFFLGGRSQASFLNEELHAKRGGLFPVTLDPTPVDLLGLLLEDEVRRKKINDWLERNNEKNATDERKKELVAKMWIENWDPEDDTKSEQDKEKARARRVNPAKILFKDPTHPFVSAEAFGLAHPLVVAEANRDNLLIAHYFHAQGSSLWKVEPQEVAEVLTMPQVRSSIDDFKQPAQDLAKSAVDLTEEVARLDPDFDKYKAAVRGYQKQIKDEALDPKTGSMAKLERTLFHLLKDAGDPNNPNRPDMPRLWEQPKMRRLKADLEKLRERVRYGDGLVYARKYRTSDDRGGYTVAILTSAGTAKEADKASGKRTGPRWNQWGAGPAQWTYPNFIRPMQAFLSSQGGSLNRVLAIGDVWSQAVEKDRYKPDVTVMFMPQEQKRNAEGQLVAPKPQERPNVRLATRGEHQWLDYDVSPAGAREPGVYTFALTPKNDPTPDLVAVAYNVDAERESDLTRTAQEKLERPEDTKNPKQGKVALLSPGEGFPEFKTQEQDVSEREWLYLLALVLLVCEQAMAVHLSYHLKGTDASGQTPARAPAKVAA
jgi:hypothetical protein